MRQKRYEVDIPDLESVSALPCCAICGAEDYELTSVQFCKEMSIGKSLLAFGAVGIETVKVNVPLCAVHEGNYRSEMKKYRSVLVGTFLPCLILIPLVGIFADHLPYVVQGPMFVLGALSGISAYVIFRSRPEFFTMRLRWTRKGNTVSLPNEKGAKALAEAVHTTMREAYQG